jgi:V/A-type H+-transporting ATPase subunit C
MREQIYPHANTIVCIEDSKLLKQFQYDILYSAKDLDATLGELNNINYFRTYRHADPDNYKALLDGLMTATFDLLREIAPSDLLNRLFALYYDIHNLKLVTKERFFGQRFSELGFDFGSYSLRTIRSAAVREADNILENETLTGGFFEALRAEDIYDVDFILDKVYFRTLKALAEELDSPEIVAFVTERIDLFNVSAFVQGQASRAADWYFPKAFSTDGSLPLAEWQEFIPHIAEGNRDRLERFSIWGKYREVWEAATSREELFSELDVRIDNYLIEKTKLCKLMAFGVEPICAYFFNKFMEIKNIRILLAGKEKDYDTEEIKKRMRIPYEL